MFMPAATRSKRRIALPGWFAALLAPALLAGAYADTPPDLIAPFPGDPRLEPVPGAPLTLSTFPALAGSVPLTLATPPRVNGQTQSDGDQHADLFVLFDGASGDPIAQPAIVEAVPVGAAPGVTDLQARLASSTWQLHAVTVAPGYDPDNPSQRIGGPSHTSNGTRVTALPSNSAGIGAGRPGSTVEPGGRTGAFTKMLV